MQIVTFIDKEDHRAAIDYSHVELHRSFDGLTREAYSTA